MNCKQKKLVFYVFLYNYLNYILKNGIIISGYKNTNKKQIKVRRMNMKKSNLIKVVVILGISLMVMLFTTNVMAANEVDLTNTIDNPSSSSNSNSNSNNSNTNSNRTNNTNTNRTNNTNNTNNSSIYNNTNLPKTGISDSIPVALLLVVFGVSSVYAYKKIRDYKNI